MHGSGAAVVKRRRPRNPGLRVLEHAGDRMAVMVIRIWNEDGRWRARMTRTMDVNARDEVSSGALVQESGQLHAVVIESVRAWLRGVTEPGPEPSET